MRNESEASSYDTSTREWRLKHLVSILLSIEDLDSFNVKYWWLTKRKTRSGVMGCALGWACHDQTFNNMGFKFVEGVPFFESHYSYEAAEKFFKISYPMALFIFSPVHYYYEKSVNRSDNVTSKVINYLDRIPNEQEANRMEDLMFVEPNFYIKPFHVIARIRFVLGQPSAFVEMN